MWEEHFPPGTRYVESVWSPFVNYVARSGGYLPRSTVSAYAHNVAAFR